MSEFNVTATEIWNVLNDFSESNEQIEFFIEDYGLHSARDGVIDMIPSIYAVADHVPERILSEMMIRGSFVPDVVKRFDFTDGAMPALNGSPIDIANDIILESASTPRL